MENKKSINQLLIFHKAGGWGKDIPFKDSEKVRVIRGTDFESLFSNDKEKIPIRYEKKEVVEEKLIRKNDILIEISGGSAAKGQLVGRTTIVDKDTLEFLDFPSIPASFCRIMRFNEDEIYPPYIYYYMQNLYNTKLISLWEKQSTGISNFQFTEFINEEFVAIKSLDEQKKLVFILELIEKKIKNNIKLIKYLEEINLKTFQYYFKFIFEYSNNSLKKKIEKKTLEEIGIEIESGNRPKGGINKNLKNGFPSVGAESIQSAGIFDFSKTKYVDEEFFNKLKRGKVKNYDVALYKDGGKPGEFKPRVGIFGNNFPFKKFAVNEHVFLLRSKVLGQPFLYNLISSKKILNNLIGKASAKAAQPGLNQKEINSIEINNPPKEIIDEFNQISIKIINNQFYLGKENTILTSLRDLLLKYIFSKEKKKYLDILLNFDLKNVLNN